MSQDEQLWWKLHGQWFYHPASSICTQTAQIFWLCRALVLHTGRVHWGSTKPVHSDRMSCAIFIWPFEIFFITSVLYLLSSDLLLHPIISQTLCLSIFCLPFILWFLFTYFHILYSALCSLFYSYYYLSTICPLFLAFPFRPWQLNTPSLVTLWVIFYILHTTPFSILLRAM